MTESEIFAMRLNDNSREFFIRMNDLLEHGEIIVKYNKNSVTYYPDTKLKQQPLVLRYTINDNGLTIELKLNHIDYYTVLIEKMPERIKDLFRSIRNCKREECNIFDIKCGMRRSWSLDGERFNLCSYKYYFNLNISNPDDAVYYAEIIKADVAAARARKKHNTVL